MKKRILVVDDDVAPRARPLARTLALEGYETKLVGTAREARAALVEDWHLVLLGSRLPDSDGLSLLRELTETRPDRPVIVIATESSVEDAVEAIKLGAKDYLRKPFRDEELLVRLKTVLDDRALRHELSAARARAPGRGGLRAVIGATEAMQEVHELVRRVAASDASTVLITGESGTGKDLIAKAIHNESCRADGPFMTITCTAIAEQLLESELFGHEKGAFTNAHALKRGLLELADGGTVFLDEIGDMPLPLQAKVLRFLQEKTFMRLGGTREMKVDVRIVAATHQPLPTRVEEGRFRQDLFYRLKVVDIVLPPLRARVEDIPLIASAFVTELNRDLNRKVTGFTPEAEACLVHYPWPGNVRELRNAIERALILGQRTTIGADDLPIEVRACAGNGAAPPVPGVTVAFVAVPRTPPAARDEEPNVYRLPDGGVNLEQLERQLVVQAMAEAHGNKTRAGRLLGLNRYQVRYRLEKYGIETPSRSRERDGEGETAEELVGLRGGAA